MTTPVGGWAEIIRIRFYPPIFFHHVQRTHPVLESSLRSIELHSFRFPPLRSKRTFSHGREEEEGSLFDIASVHFSLSLLFFSLSLSLLFPCIHQFAAFLNTQTHTRTHQITLNPWRPQTRQQQHHKMTSNSRVNRTASTRRPRQWSSPPTSNPRAQ